MSVTPASREELAIHGGPPVRRTLLPYGRQSIDEDDIQAVVDVLRSDWLTTGPKVGEFEEAFAARTGREARGELQFRHSRLACRRFCRRIESRATRPSRRP